MKAQDYDYVSVGTRIKNARKAKSFTQEYVAECVDIGCQHISDIERGVCGLSVTTLIKLCRTLEVSADYLLFGKAGTGLIDGLCGDMDEAQRKFVEDFIALYAESLR